MVTLEGKGFKIGDIVTFADDDSSTGGILFQIFENFDSPIPKSDRRYGARHVHPTTGKALKPMEVEGYLRLKPLYSFYPTNLGANPKGAKSTVLVYHNQLPRVKKVDLIELATKYAELGNIVRDVAVAGGMLAQEG